MDNISHLPRMRFFNFQVSGLLSLLDNPRKFLRVSLPIALTCTAERMMKVRRKGIMVERKERRKKGRESVSDTVIEILCSTSMEMVCTYVYNGVYNVGALIQCKGEKIA